jgi:hypothetical protein
VAASPDSRRVRQSRHEVAELQETLGLCASRTGNQPLAGDPRISGIAAFFDSSPFNTPEITVKPPVTNNSCRCPISESSSVSGTMCLGFRSIIHPGNCRRQHLYILGPKSLETLEASVAADVARRPPRSSSLSPPIRQTVDYRIGLAFGHMESLDKCLRVFEPSTLASFMRGSSRKILRNSPSSSKISSREMLS